MAMGEKLFTTLVLMAAGILAIVTGVLSQRGKLPRNWFLGLRTPSTLKSDEAWRAAHRAAGSLIVVSGFALGGTGVVALVLNPRDSVILVGTGLAIAVLIFAAVVGVRAAKKFPGRPDGNR